MQPTPLTERHYREGPNAPWICELYCLWRLCGRSACRRAQACRGNVERCGRGLALVPQAALDFLPAFEAAREQELSFEEMIDVCGDELYALERWRGQVGRSVAE
jgi:hypothetical protein